MIYGLLSFDYEMVTAIYPSDGAMNWVVLLVRLVSWFSTIALGFSLFQLVISSGVL